MSDVAIVALVLAMIVLAWGFWTVNRQAAARTVGLLNRARYIIGGIWLAIIGYHLLQSGSLVLVTLALLGTFAVGLWALVERPWRDVI